MSRPCRCVVLTLFLVSCACMRSNALDWPSHFWTQITNSMALPSGSQISSVSGTISLESVSGDVAFADELGNDGTPFDSRWCTSGTSNLASLDSRPCGMVLTLR
jgi:hypothetical protein